MRYQLKTTYHDGTIYMIFESLYFIARLAALVPKSRVNLMRFHGVFAPNSRHCLTITPTKQVLPRGQGKAGDKKQQSMSWAQRLKRFVGLDIETYHQCGGVVKVIARIDN